MRHSIRRVETAIASAPFGVHGGARVRDHRRLTAVHWVLGMATPNRAGGESEEEEAKSGHDPFSQECHNLAGTATSAPSRFTTGRYVAGAPVTSDGCTE